MAKKEELFPNWSVTFQLEADEKTKDFFERMDKEHKDLEAAAKERITHLFHEFVTLEGPAKIAEDKFFGLFSIGYQLGWNDCHAVSKETKE